MKEQIENLQKSFELSSQQIDDAVNPLEVAALFESKNVSYVLIGGHMLSYYTGTARATVDVDFIIGGTDFERASKEINKAYAQFKHHNRVYHVTYDTQKTHEKDPERIDLVKDGFPLFKAVVQKYCVTLRAKKQVVKIPTIEAAIALKFAASISPNRGDENKPIDNADLMRLIRATPNLNEHAILALGELVYSGGGKELAAVVNDVRQGKTISL
ncbi:MAG: hypothetical protein HOM14_18870 [Gammaproteobacteria bacterium]|jgi:hypothetical protein|nr:hypothetical protein [Gammaproteobacteria bacterium]MBT4075338.1 hypothetical protein [Gammaproteobacteria bacterium]MBT4195792.1 hypothetical protein [Gammaproteobacteria bacterium]MBT4448110.1 hypothetical protein [Gammaproteobacteria bacterium]MBT4860110.1 hypothetical protein [Gammaproteobacteria bacterium]